MRIVTTIGRLRRLVEDLGHVIVWCGNVDEVNVLVDTQCSNVAYFYTIDIWSEMQLLHVTSTVRNGEASKPGTTVSSIPANQDFFAVLRAASAMGVNIGGSCKPGSGMIAKDTVGCICGYDIELDMRGEQRGGFPMESVPILSCALKCTCGYQLFLTSMNMKGDNVKGNLTSVEICHGTVDALTLHRPQWSVGWNNFSFDNSCLKYHSADKYNSMFHQVKVGSASVVDYGYVMNVPGVYNIDPFCYMQRNPYHNYEDMSLAGVAKAVGALAKKDMPDLYGSADPYEIMEYNMADSAAAADIVVKTGLTKELYCLAVCSAAPLYDCVRYMTGAMAAMVYSTDAIEQNMDIDWSASAREVIYLGGKVLEPERGLHDDVVIVDFSSMYPNIMIDGRISTETVAVLGPQGNKYGNVSWDDDNIWVDLGDCVGQYPRSGNNIQRQSLLKGLQLRNMYKKSHPVYSKGLKVVNNCAYGATGYVNSPMYGPVTSASVTAVGRWLLSLAVDTFEKDGLRVVYGDTDSCMVKPTSVTAFQYKGDVVKHAQAALSKLHAKLDETPFTSMRMELEDYHPRVMFLDKKKYCKIDKESKVTYKGVSVVRSDTLGIAKHCFSKISGILLELGNSDESKKLISEYVCFVAEQAFQKRLKPWDVSMVKKQNARKCYVYTDSRGEKQPVPIDLSQNIVVDYDTLTVLASFNKEVSRLLTVCRMGTVDDIVTQYAPVF